MITEEVSYEEKKKNKQTVFKGWKRKETNSKQLA